MKLGGCFSKEDGGIAGIATDVRLSRRSIAGKNEDQSPEKRRSITGKTRVEVRE